MVNLEEFVKLNALYKILVSNTSHDWDNIDLLAIVLDLKVVSNKGVVFIANCHHLFIWTDVKTQRLPVVVPALVGQRHLY